jgi:hypothetical protein
MSGPEALPFRGGSARFELVLVSQPGQCLVIEPGLAQPLADQLACRPLAPGLRWLAAWEQRLFELHLLAQDALELGVETLRHDASPRPRGLGAAASCVLGCAGPSIDRGLTGRKCSSTCRRKAQNGAAARSLAAGSTGPAPPAIGSGSP